MVVSKNFKLIAPVEKVEKNIDDNGSDTLFIEGIANSGMVDLVGDIVTTEALQSIVDQATNCNLHYNHYDDRTDILGTIVESNLVNEGAWIKASIINEQQEWIKSYLEQNIKFGLSISGTCDYEEGSYSDIIDWQLTEISLTDTPCDPNTMGTVSLSKSFDTILRSIKNKKKMEDKPMAEGETDATYITEDDATKLINDAFNERKEEFLESIREDIKNEYDAKISA